MEFSITNEVKELQIYEYKNRRAKETISMMASPTGLLVEGSVLRNLLSQGFELHPTIDNKSEYNPQAMFDALAKYATPHSVTFDERIWNQAYALTLKAFNPDRVQIPTDVSFETISLAVKDDKSSGAPDFTKKGDVKEKDYRRMWKWLNGEITPYPCVAFHRVQHGAEGPKQRLVWGYPQAMTMAESIFARPLIEHFLTHRTPMTIGLRRFQLSARMVTILNTYVKYGFDFSGFDSSICPELINMAFSILKGMIRFVGPEDRKWFRKVKEYFINTPILMPDGNVYLKRRGVPSGSYFTQMVDSIVNYFVIQYANIKLSGIAIHPEKILVLGDDSLFASPKLYSLKTYAGIMSEIGLKLNADKTDCVLEGEDVHYLGHVWKHGLVDRAPIDVAKRMAFPEKRSKIQDPRERIKHRIYPYVSDALSAHQIIAGYSRGRGVPYPTYSHAGVMCEDGEIGWKEYLALVTDSYSRNEAEFYYQCYLGILK